MSESEKDINELEGSQEEQEGAVSEEQGNPEQETASDEENASQEEKSAAAPRGSRERLDSNKGVSTWVVAVAAVVLGGAGGWFGQKLQTEKAMKAADAAVAGQGDAARGPCKDWETKICDEFGANAFACNQAKTASPLLPGSACQLALKAVPVTLTKIHAARTSCDSVSAKLCAELGAETQTCKMVQKDTPTFPPEKCEEIVKNYDQVVTQLKSMEQRGGMGGPPGASPVRGGPPGMPPQGPHPGMGAPPPGHP